METKYKCVTADLGSVCVAGSAELQYSETTWTHGLTDKYGPLVFSTLEDAVHWMTSPAFMIDHDNDLIYEVEVQNKLELPPICSIGMLYDGAFVEDRGANWPDGTEMYECVRLLKRVSPEKIDRIYYEMNP